MFLRRTDVLGVPIWHSVRSGFGDLLRRALTDQPIGVALGPLYADDPGAELLRPFTRSAAESCYKDLSEEDLAPDSILQEVRAARSAAIPHQIENEAELNDWARAGLVLEIARRRGIHVSDRGIIHVDWRLNATVTGRFGAETVRGHGWSLNPLSMGPEDRRRIRPSDAVREIAVLDFKAMDVCSMRVLIPELDTALGDHPDPYQVVADLTGLTREAAKLSFLTWAYGGAVDPHVLDQLGETFGMVTEFTKRLPHGTFPRAVQTISAGAFRAGLSRALPFLVGDNVLPMFTVHDELVLDVSEMGWRQLDAVTGALTEGASQTTGGKYRVGVRTGYTYEEAKNG